MPRGFEEPGVGLAGVEAFHFQPQRKWFGLGVGRDPGVKNGVVPGVADCTSALTIGSGGVAFEELGKKGSGSPAESEREVAGVHAEVAEGTDFAAGGGLAFPVGGLVGVEIGGVVESGDGFEETTAFAGADVFEGGVGTGEKKGNSEEQRTKQPCSSPLALILFAEARSMPKGFSASRSLPD